MPGRVGEFCWVAEFGRVERPGQARASLRGDAGPVIFEEDPGSVACPGFIPPTMSKLDYCFESHKSPNVHATNKRI